MQPGSRVWCANPKEAGIWCPGVVTDSPSAETYQVQLARTISNTGHHSISTNDLVEVPADDCVPANMQFDENGGVFDVGELDHAHEAGVANNLAVNFEKGRQFSMGGGCLFFCSSAEHPNKSLFSGSTKEKYRVYFSQKYMLDKLPTHRM